MAKAGYPDLSSVLIDLKKKIVTKSFSRSSENRPRIFLFYIAEIKKFTKSIEKLYEVCYTVIK